MNGTKGSFIGRARDGQCSNLALTQGMARQPESHVNQKVPSFQQGRAHGDVKNASCPQDTAQPRGSAKSPKEKLYELMQSSTGSRSDDQLVVVAFFCTAFSEGHACPAG